MKAGSPLLKTTGNLEKTGAFTVAFGTVDTVLISDYFVVETGKKVNKIEKASCHVHASAHVNAPIIEEYPLTLECKVKSWDTSTGYLIGEIVASQADASILIDSKVDLGKLRPIIFDPSFGAYRMVGEIVGKAFSDGLKLKQENRMNTLYHLSPRRRLPLPRSLPAHRRFRGAGKVWHAAQMFPERASSRPVCGLFAGWQADALAR